MNLESYKKTVALLLEILPYALKDERMALKGGTAINLFHRNFPRISVDIDLCYLPLEDRPTTLINIHSILAMIKESLEKKLGLKVLESSPLNGKREAKIIAIQKDAKVIIEPNFILRSSLFPVQNLELSVNASKEFHKSVKARCLNIADTYGGKICAALDRQHPRDLFDVKYLLENEGITIDIKDSFVFYLISHNRPIYEILAPNFKDISREYNEEFLDMSQVKIELEDLLDIREKLVDLIHATLTENDKKFLISFISNQPDWSLVRDSKIKEYPSVKWKLHNIAKMNEIKKLQNIDKLKKCLFGV